MKKLVLSAVMLVAFSTVSMAKTKPVNFMKSKVSKTSYYVAGDCLAGAQATYNNMLALCADESTAFAIAESGYWACMGATTTPKK